MACGFAALCYAEFASKIPIAGSAYTYAYASFGEFLAWIIGWDLLVEYAIGNIAVAISWSDYFTSLCAQNGINIPLQFTMDFRTAQLAHRAVEAELAKGGTLETLQAACAAKNAVISCAQVDGFSAWAAAPKIGGVALVADLPALGIVFIITALVYIGIRESKTASNIMVALKLAIILLVIIRRRALRQSRQLERFHAERIRRVDGRRGRGLFCVYRVSTRFRPRPRSVRTRTRPCPAE